MRLNASFRSYLHVAMTVYETLAVRPNPVPPLDRFLAVRLIGEDINQHSDALWFCEAQRGLGKLFRPRLVAYRLNSVSSIAPKTSGMDCLAAAHVCSWMCCDGDARAIHLH